MFVCFSTYDCKELPKSIVFKLILYVSQIFGKHKELRFLGWCTNYDMQTPFDGVKFKFENYLVQRNSNVLLKGLNNGFCKYHFCETFLNFYSVT